ncbi:unnamed protein product [Ceutorhynchus assimilis]|uniref:Carboxylesterase type B domain-containing protein n=1 Tax=Ceutorhynchus assimilis TaxID=467358 RepID=A0A9P0GP45_9CUCU|nr:unnamed protein product [Ceutorhynchus assimilis]
MSLIHFLLAILRPVLIYYDIVMHNWAPHSMTKDVNKRIFVGGEIENFFFNGLLIAISDERFIELMSVDQFDRGIRQAATLMSFWTKVYCYVFGYESKTEKLYKGVAHGEDLGYFFTYANERKTDPTDIKVSEILVKLWSNFVKKCDPTPHFNNTIWHPLNATASNFNYMSINESMVPAVNPKQKSWEFYKNKWLEYGDNNPDLMTTY